MLVISTFKRETQRPSAEKVWQQPVMEVLPMVPERPARSSPLEVQAASYFAASARIFSLSSSSMVFASNTNIEHLYYTIIVRRSEMSRGKIFLPWTFREMPLFCALTYVF